MTSVLAAPAPSGRLPNPSQLVVNTYSDAVGNDAPLPFRINRQTGAIDFEFVNGFTASTTTDNNQSRYFQGQVFKALHLVQSLGPNFIQWCENSSDIGADVGTVEMTEQPVVCYANLVAVNEDPNNSTLESGLSSPPDLTTAAGPESSQYYKTLVFIRPLVIKYKVSGTTNYAYFNNNFEGNT